MKKCCHKVESCPLHNKETGGLLTKASLRSSWGVRVETPAKLDGKKQFSVEEDIHNRKISQVRVYVERGITRVKVSATLQDRPRADRCSAFSFLINSSKPYIF